MSCLKMQCHKCKSHTNPQNVRTLFSRKRESTSKLQKCYVSLLSLFLPKISLNFSSFSPRKRAILDVCAGYRIICAHVWFSNESIATIFPHSRDSIRQSAATRADRRRESRRMRNLIVNRIAGGVKTCHARFTHERSKKQVAGFWNLDAAISFRSPSVNLDVTWSRLRVRREKKRG